LVEIDPKAYLIFDDTTLNKSFRTRIKLVRKQCSGTKKGRDPWRGVVSCVYVNPKTEHWFIKIDWVRLQRFRRERALSKCDLSA
jgi:hypothetical protein